jgi:glucosamine-6-phosphate deaminase
VSLSKVEQVALTRSDYDCLYPPVEKIPVLVTESFPQLGKLTALRFLEWVQAHPGGVISLPTGKTPEHFIAWINYFRSGWDQPDVAEQLEQAGLDPAVKPDLSGLHFVQIDEFYPIESAQANSFYHYVMHYYVEGFGLDPAKCLLINASRIGLADGETLADYWPDNTVDLSLRYRQARGALEEKQKALLSRIDQWCMDYEQRIEALGGIGFFLGGIGPDGHIGFNIKGSDHHSTTRLCPTNYETQAAAATDLGGIEISRNRLVITIGLKTITANPNCTAIIMAAGAAKAGVVADAIQSDPDVDIPATSLHALHQARFYITEGAAVGLTARRLERTMAQTEFETDDIERILIDLACKANKSLLALTEKDCQSDDFGRELLAKRSEPIGELARLVEARLIAKIQKGSTSLENTCFLHTEPHHDDVMLGYLPHVVRNVRRASNTHHFMTLTSGFTSVTNAFMIEQIRNLQCYMSSNSFAALLKQGYFEPHGLEHKNRDVWQYLDGVAALSEEIKAEGCSRRLFRNLVEITGTQDIKMIQTTIDGLLAYFDDAYPGKFDPPQIQRLKGMSREWEAECLWGYYGWKCENVHHLRLGFYKGTIFTEEPTYNRDVEPIVKQLEQIRPDVVTVAFDPEGSGPDTHYKVLQAMAEALRVYQKKTGRQDIRIWGYRNVWYRFDPSEVDIFVPVSLCMFSVMEQAFMNSFLSQKNASFPSYEYDGPFSHLAQQIQVRQYQRIKCCLGREWFYHHDSPLIRATRGLVYLKEMQTEEFYQSCRKLRKSVEDHA